MTPTTMFTQHCQVVRPSGIISPRPVTITVQRPNPVFVHGTKAQRDEALDQMIALEREQNRHRLDAEAEKQTEGRVFPSRVNPHDD